MASVTLALLFILYSVTLLSVNADSLQELLFGGSYEFIDLTHPFDNLTVYWPGTDKFHFTKKTEKSDSWYAANEFAAAEHGGTHLDAPYHFFQTGKFVGDLPLNKFIVPMVIADVSAKVNDNPDYVLMKQSLDTILGDHFGKPCVLIFKFGWSKFFHNPQKYLGNNGTSMRFPGISTEVADWIVSYKHIVGVGVDTSSVDPGSSTDFAAHKVLAKAGLYNMENINLHKPMNAYKCTALVLPMKIGMGTGAPLRLVAICPKETGSAAEF